MGPAIMHLPASPPAPDELVKMYLKLHTLFPGWKGHTGQQTPQIKHEQGHPQQQQQRPGSISQPNSAGMLPSQNAAVMNNAQQQMNSTGQQMANMQHAQAQALNGQQQQPQQQMNQMPTT